MNKSGLPFCSDLAKVLALNNAERKQLMLESDINYHCPLSCINTEYKGLVTRVQSGLSLSIKIHVYMIIHDILVSDYRVHLHEITL